MLLIAVVLIMVAVERRGNSEWTEAFDCSADSGSGCLRVLHMKRDGVWEKLEIVSLKKASAEFKVQLLRALGFDIDTSGVHVTKDGKPVNDRYVGKLVTIENMAVLPPDSGGTPIILDDNLVSLACYMEEYGELP